MKKDRYALIDFDGNVKLTSDNPLDLEQTLKQSIKRLKTDAAKLRRVADGVQACYHGISDPDEAGQIATQMMAQAEQRESWAVIENV